MRAILLLACLFLVACAAVEQEMIIVEPVMEEPAGALEPCGDDGIGGTGCPGSAN